MPQALLLAPKARRRINSHDNAPQLRCNRNPPVLDVVALENGVGIILDQFAVEFLPP